jgi:hypothetical protein
MTSIVIDKREDKAGRNRYFVLPVETADAFADLMAFVSQDGACTLEGRNEGLGTITQSGLVEGHRIIFVLSDATGAQFYAESPEGDAIAARLALTIEKRIQEVT